jgi:phage baseplate assembly protein W
MSSLEKNLYKRVRVNDAKGTRRPKSGTTYRGMSSVNKENTSYRLYDIALIKQDLINHFHIRRGEKLENPSFGTLIWDAIFEPLTEDLKSAIVDDIKIIISSDPRMSVDKVFVDQYESGILVECVITFIGYDISEKMRLSFDENIGLLS